MTSVNIGIPKALGERVQSWEEFQDWIDSFGRYRDGGFIFRGQACSEWPLLSSLDRKKWCLEPEQTVDDRLEEHLNRFKRAMRGIQKNHGLSDADDDNTWWAMGQHHGLMTPLLDWTFSPYIALYFALRDPQPSKSGYRSVWMLNVHAIRDIASNIKSNDIWQEDSTLPSFLEKKRAPTVELVDPYFDNNHRLLSQNGVFTRGPIGCSIEQWLTAFGDRTERQIAHHIMIDEYMGTKGKSETMPHRNDMRSEYLDRLYQMNIHERSLFPDIMGAATYCNHLFSRYQELVLRANNARDMLSTHLRISG